MNQQELIEIAKAKQGGISEYKLAQMLGVSNQKVSNWKNGGVKISTYGALRLALLADLDPVETLAQIESGRAENETQADWWRGFLSSMGRGLNSLLLAFLIFCGLAPAKTPNASAAETAGRGSHNVRLRKIAARSF
ncbi:MAG: hypothetical protein HQL31_08275 [Planctomycetes bacterium]|nr:hypothetical protein [Planctomycetota bacterium]